MHCYKIITRQKNVNKNHLNLEFYYKYITILNI